MHNAGRNSNNLQLDDMPLPQKPKGMNSQEQNNKSQSIIIISME